MKRIWTEGKRKLVYGSAAFVALVSFAFYTKAEFGSFATSMEFWLTIMLAGHIAAEKLGKAPTGGQP